MFDYAAYARQLREELHRIPEIGFDLPKTLAVVHRELEAMGLSHTDKYGPSSVVAYINPGMPFTIGLRGDMDALPIQEENDVPYKSTHPGISHACGHDSHTAILLATAKRLVDNKDQLKCTVKLMFTPAEEYETPGCKILAENGIMDDVDCALATHVTTDKIPGQFVITDGDQGGNSMGFKVRFYGKSAHAVSQEKGKDAIMTAIETVTAMQIMVAKEIHVSKPKVLNIGSFHGGKTNNVICDYVEIFGSCRAAEDSVSEYMERRLQEICKGMELTSGCKIEYEHVKLLPYRKTSPVLFKKIWDLGEKLFGEGCMSKPARRGLGGEDFGYLTRKKPCLFISFGVKDPAAEKGIPVHTTKFDIHPDSYAAPLDLIYNFVLENMNGIDFGG